MSRADDRGDLDALRGRLDEIDAALTDLFAERLAIAARVAQHKARAGDRLFHRDREERIIETRRRDGAARGLDPELVEDVFRRLILESHITQSAILRTARDENAKTIAIVGGAGAMGSFLARFFAEQGHDVLVADVDTPLTPEAAAERADVVIISVPIAVTEEIIGRVGPRVRTDAALMDVTSLKQAPVRAMLDATDAEVVGLHPMFGPSAGSIHRQVVAVCPGRGGRWLGWVRETLHSQGAELVECSTEEHDRAMAVIQVLRHSATMAFGRALRDLGVDLDESLRYSSPIYRLELMMTGRLFAQSPDLYADLSLGNDHRGMVVDALEQAVAAIAEVVRNGDRDAFIAEFQRIGGFFEGFSDQALAESGHLISKMVERM